MTFGKAALTGRSPDIQPLCWHTFQNGGVTKFAVRH
jgi:hypothetical protein